jgi:hypothetical protein
MSMIAVGSAMVVTSAYSGYQQYKSGKEQKAMADRNAAMMQMEAEAQADTLTEEFYRSGRDQREAFSRQSMASQGMGGFASEGTSDMYFQTDMVKQFMLSNLDNRSLVTKTLILGANQADMERWRGSVAKNLATSQAVSTVVQGTLGAVGGYQGYQADVNLANQLRTI